MGAILLPALARSVPALVGALFVVGVTNSTLDLAMNAQGVSVERHLGRPILSSLHAAFSFGGFAGAGLGALAAALDVAPLPHFLVAVALFGIPGLIATRPLLAQDEDADAHAPAMRWRALPSRLLLLGIACLFCLMAEGGASDWSAKLVHDDLAGSAALGLGLAGVVPTLFRAGADQPGVSTGPALAAVTSLGYLGFLGGPPLIGGAAHRGTSSSAAGSLAGSAAVR